MTKEELFKIIYSIVDESRKIKLNDYNNKLYIKILDLGFDIYNSTYQKSNLRIVFDNLSNILKDFRKHNLHKKEEFKSIFIELSNLYHDIYITLNSN